MQSLVIKNSSAVSLLLLRAGAGPAGSIVSWKGGFPIAIPRGSFIGTLLAGFLQIVVLEKRSWTSKNASLGPMGCAQEL